MAVICSSSPAVRIACSGPGSRLVLGTVGLARQQDRHRLVCVFGILVLEDDLSGVIVRDRLIDHDRGDLLKQSTKLSPMESSGSMTVSMTVDVTKALGKSVVVYQTVTDDYSGKIVLQHPDKRSNYLRRSFQV